MRIEFELKNPKSCELCPCNYVDMIYVSDNIKKKRELKECMWGCTLDYYIGIILKPKSIKRRPKRCIEERGI